jgi:DNA-directed RNA polymerase alpha subunit
MSAKIEELKESGDIMTFTLTGVDCCYANGLRRVILSEIPVVVFKTTPHEENKSNILINTSRLNNEIIKQRLSCIPICIKDLEIDFPNYQLELDVENKTDTMLMVTTKHFKIKNLTTDAYLDENTVREIFPPYIPPTGKSEYYIDFLRLRPKISDELPGERIKLTCAFTVSTARDDSMFNIVGTCSYGFTPDREEMVKQLALRKDKWSNEGKNQEEIIFESKNWNLLEGLRYVKNQSFDFIIQTIGIFENTDIVIKACQILIKKIEIQKQLLEKDELRIEPSVSTLENCYDVILDNEDYTVGVILNNELYETFYKQHKILSYTGFKKMHPHDTDSIIRVAFNSQTSGKSSVKEILTTVIVDAVRTIDSIIDCFSGRRRK